MKLEIKDRKEYDFVEVDIEEGEQIYAQPSAYLMHIREIEIESKM